MPSRHNFFWGALSIVFAILILLILGLAVCAPKPEPITIGGQEVPPPPNISAPAAITPSDQASPEVKSSIDASNKIGIYLKITGWVYVENQETLGQEVYVQLKKPDASVVHYLTAPVKRPDVGAAFKNPLYNASGFTAVIPLKGNFDIKACAIRLVVKNKNRLYTSTLCRIPKGR